MPLKIETDVTEIIQTLIGLTSQLAVTNQHLSWIGDEVKAHSGIIFGDGQAKGGLVLSVSQLTTIQEVHKKELETLDIQVSNLSRDCSRVLGMVEIQAGTIKNMQKAVYTLVIVVAIILFAVGIADFKTLITIFAGLL